MFQEAFNGEYFILQADKTYYLYDDNFNKKYESTNYLTPLNGGFVIEKEKDALSIVDVSNGKKSMLDVKGELYNNTQSAVITKDKETNMYYLYRID